MTDDSRSRVMIQELPGYEPEVGRLLWMLVETRRRTKERLDGMDASLLDWIPDPAANSIGALLYHVAAIEADWVYVEALGVETFPPELSAVFPEDPHDESGRLAESQGVSLEEGLHRLNVVRGLVLAAFRGMSLADFRRVRDFPDYSVTPEGVVHYLIQHEAEHRGQIDLLRGLAESAKRDS